MLDYVVDALKRFHHLHPHKHQDQPYHHVKPTYGAKKKYMADLDTSPLISKADKKLYKRLLAPSYTMHGQSIPP